MSGLTGVVYAPYAPAQPFNGAQAMPQVPARAQPMRRNARIDGLTSQDAGAGVPILRSVKRVPLTNPLTKAWLTVKTAETVADPGSLQLAITTTNTVAGQITDDGHATGTGQLKFTPTQAQLGALTAGASYVYDLQLKFQDGTEWTAEKGTLLVEAPVTQATN